MSQTDWFKSRAQDGRCGFIESGGALPDGEFNARTKCLAELLTTRFPERETRIGLWGENSLEYLIALFAVLRAGHVAVPINTRFTARELKDICLAADVRGMLVARDYPDSLRAALTGIPTYALAQRIEAKEGAAAVRLRAIGERDVAILLCTSGSSGRAKMVPYTLRGLFEHAQAVCAHLKVTWRDSWVACLPFYHIGGLTIPFRCFISGATLIVSRSSDPDDLNHLIDVEEASLISVVGTVFERMLNRHAGKDYPKTLRAIIVGGGPVPAPLLARCVQACATYGLSEAGSMVTCARPDCSDEERVTAGPALHGSEVRIIDANGKEVKAGIEGQIIVRGPGMAQGYSGDREATAKTFKNGWIHTGDLGLCDKHGWLHVHARREDLVLSGGENVYPAEIEAALKEHARITEAVVLPIASEEWGQIPGAFIVLAPGRPLTRIHIFQHLEDRLARHKFPRVLVFADELPTLPTGKPDLALIRKRLAEEKLKA
jgi:o-succinylbenzoate---CoA ligase